MAFQDKKIRLRVFNLSAFGDDLLRHTVCMAGRLLLSKRSSLPHRQSMSDAAAKGDVHCSYSLGSIGWNVIKFE